MCNPKWGSVEAANPLFLQQIGVSNTKLLLQRGHKFVQEHIKSVSNADDVAWKAAYTLHSAGKYAEMGAQLVGGRGGDKLHQAGEYVSNMGVAYQILFRISTKPIFNACGNEHTK